MTDYQRMYIAMFRAAETAVRFLEEDMPKEAAIFVLKLGQIICEEIYIATADEDEAS
ncbi:MAG: hypothetical protein IJA67_11275 [Oscillospiraceae bacterium]|nr:hypothetical protein [Oscillospiraceae bacterium]